VVLAAAIPDRKTRYRTIEYHIARVILIQLHNDPGLYARTDLSSTELLDSNAIGQDATG
jgi:hypothetical protein